jgi:hypothetical protein
MLLLPIHGQPNDVLSNIISNLRGCMRRILAGGSSMLLLPIHGQPNDVLSNIISNLEEAACCCSQFTVSLLEHQQFLKPPV